MAAPLLGRWIFVAEDDAFIALDLADALERAGAKVATAHTLGQAMRLLDHQAWAGAVLDYALCDEDCTPVCEWFRDREIPFILCTGYDEISGPCAHGTRLLKPITSDEVADTMCALVAA